MTDTPYPSLNVQFLGCSKDPMEILFSAYKINNSDDNPLNTWKNIRRGTISKEQIKQTIEQTKHKLPTTAHRQVQFVFLIENISTLSLNHLELFNKGLNRASLVDLENRTQRKTPTWVIPPELKKQPEIFSHLQKIHSELALLTEQCQKNDISDLNMHYLLPSGTANTEQLSIGFTEMQLFLDEQMCEEAEWEIHDLSWQIYQIMKKEFPTLADRLGPKCWENRHLFCDKAYESYQNCKWSQCRSHKADLSGLWGKLKHRSA